jgi:hypothetical protein
MERELEKGLETRLGRMILPPQTAVAMKEDSRRLASLYLKDQSPQKITDSMGVATVYNFSFVDKQDDFNRMFAETERSRPLYWALGAAFGRSEKNPGGMYALTLIVVPDLRDELKIYGDLEAVILEAIQKIRSMARAPKLDSAAKKVSMMFYKSIAILDSINNRDRRKLTLAYQTLSLAEIPDDIAQKIAGTPKISSAGIHVLYPLIEGLPGNYFIVAILAN